MEQKKSQYVQQWQRAVADGLGYRCYTQSVEDESGRIQGVLPLVLVSTRLFGKMLVSLPYTNSAGVIADNDVAASDLVDQAIDLAESLDVDHLQLRQEVPVLNERLNCGVTDKVLMRLPLPENAASLWESFKPKVRNQVRKGERCELTIDWGNEELLPDFYRVFARNMRDLGTPVYGKRLFRSILRTFGTDAELCVVRKQGQAVAAALLVHGPHGTEVPSASSLRAYNSINANMFMYWQLLKRAVERGCGQFDFGRSTDGSNTYRFKKQWGAVPCDSVWQYHVRRGSVLDTRPNGPKFRLAIQLWKKLPVSVASLIGPRIIRGIP